MDKYIRLLINNRVTILIGLLLLSLIGIKNGVNLPVDAVPDITNVQVVVNIKTAGLDPEQIEKSITRPVEMELQGLPNLEQLRSISKFGLSQTVLVFKDGTNIYWARQTVGLKMQALQSVLPAGSEMNLAPISTGLGEVVMYAVLPRENSKIARDTEVNQMIYLRTIQDNVIKPYLMANVKGIAESDVNGGYKKQIHINLDPVLLEKNGLTIDEVVNRIQTIGRNVGGGYAERKDKQIIVHTSGTIDIKTLNQVPIKMSIFGNPVLLSHVAAIEVHHMQRLGGATYNGKEAVIGNVLMLIGENSREVARSAEEALKKIKLPDDVNVEIVYSRNFLVNATLQTVIKNLSEGAALVALVLFLLLGNLRAAMITVFAIPLCMLFVVIGMDYFQVSASLMSLGALDFGLLVDGSIVFIENYMRLLGGRDPSALGKSERMGILARCMREVIKPVAVGLCIIMLVYIPILSFQGIEGKLYKPMAYVVLMGMASSLLAAVAVMPVIAYLFLRGSRHRSTEPVLFRMLQAVFIPLSRFAVRHARATSAAAASILIFSVVGFLALGSEFMPALNEGDMVMNITRESGVSLNVALKEQALVEKIILKNDEVERVFSRMGTNEAATDPMGIPYTDCFVILKNKLTPDKRKLFEDLKREILKAYPSYGVSESQPIEMRFNEILEGSRADISLRIYGKDLDKLYAIQDNVVEILEKIPGIAEVELDALTALKKSPVMTILYDYAALARYDIDLNEVNSIIETALAGKEVGDYFENDWKYPIIVRFDDELKKTPAQIEKIPVPVKGGGTIPLGYVAKIREEEKVTSIARSNSYRYAGVAINLKDRDPLSFIKDAQQKVNLQTLGLSSDFDISWEGQFKNLRQAQIRLAVVVPLILGIIFYLLYLTFHSVTQALLVFTGIPLALSGGIIALHVTGIHFSISAAVGFIALMGIAVLNGLVLISFINGLMQEKVPLKEALQRAIEIRLRPILMTALVASLGFLPMAVNTGVGAEMQRPLAVVVMGGIITSTFLTLVIMPALIIMFNKQGK